MSNVINEIFEKHGRVMPEFLRNASVAAVLDELEEAFLAKSKLSELERQAVLHGSIITFSDAYKSSHFLQYPPDTERVYSYIESRGGKWSRTEFFGLQAFLKKYLSNPFTQADIDFGEEIITGMGLPFNREGWEYILKTYGGKLPVTIKAVKEGTVVDGKNVLCTIVNTDPKCYWLTSYLETALLRAIWYPTTVATSSFHAKLHIIAAMEKSSDTPKDIAFKLNDFSPRGVSSHESSEIGGMAHLTNFKGTDNIEGVIAARLYYSASIAGFSIPAAEHSTITSWGRHGEQDAYNNMLVKFAKPGSVVAIVSDSYDLWNVIENMWGKALKQKILDSGACVVVRPDSGDPLTIPVQVIQRLADAFGYTINSKGYKVLPSCIRVIQGDGITEESLPIILKNLLDAGFSADNLNFGMGGGLLQMVNRDDLKFAMKCSAVSRNGIWYDVRKEPITDPGKRSKAGRFILQSVTGAGTVPLTAANENSDLLQTVYHNGDMPNQTEWDEVCNIANEAAYRLAA